MPIQADTAAKPPAPLGPGARIRVVAPSGRVDPERLARGVDILRQRFRFEVSCDIPEESDRYLAGADSRRLEGLKRAFADPEIDGIWCGRGGYGAIRIASALEEVATRPIPLIGFSDITVLHAVLERQGIRSWHGPVVAQLGDLDDASLTQAEQILAGSESPDLLGSGEIEVLRGGRAEGPLRGGNLTMLASLAGTPWTPNLRDAIVFMEDVGESVYRLDRCLQQLRHACGLEEAAAVVLGAFTGVPAGEADWLEALWSELAQTLRCPVVKGLPIGHRSPNWTLPLGAHVTLTTEPPSMRIEAPWVTPA